MWKIRLVFISLFFSHLLSYAQFGNEWIDYSQQYYSFAVYENGVYKIEYDALSAVGIPVGSIDPEDFQIFGFEEEQEIWVEGGEDGSFDSGDYLLFYASKNTTWLDSMLYDEPEQVANKYYPHFNDTINYYLSWGDGVNQRMTEETDVDFDSYTAVPYFYKTVEKHHNAIYLEGYKVSGMSGSSYSDGEGWFGARIVMSAAVNYRDDILLTANRYTGADAPLTRGIAVSAGASNGAYDGDGNHHLQLQYGTSNTILFDTIFTGYQKNTLNFTIPTSELGGATTRIRHQLVNDLGVLADYQCVAFSELTFPHIPNLEGTSYYELTVPYNDTESKSFYPFVNFTAADPWLITLDGETKKIPVLAASGFDRTIIPNLPSGNDQRVVIFDAETVPSITNLKAINGTGFFTNYSTTDFEKAFLIISHKRIWSSANEYKAYRESGSGGMYNVVLADVDELYHQFGGGVPKHVMGIRRFAHYAYDQAALKPENLFILGKGIREAKENLATGNGTRQSASSYYQGMIPSFGYPTSDNLITARLEDNLWAPLIPTGRLAANTNEDVLGYLGKVMEHEMGQDPTSYYSVKDKLWQKEILHFGGGANEVEQNTFKFYLENYEDVLEGTKFGGNVQAYYKSVSDPVDPSVLFEVTDIIDEGVSLMTFFGHASVEGFDQNIDNPENWNNKGKYPIVVGNACLTGNIFEPANSSASEEYVLIEDKGAIIFLANVKQAFSNSLDGYSKVLFQHIAETSYGLSVGEQSRRTVLAVQSDVMSFGLRNVCNQMTLHGDPSIKVNNHERPELEINSSSISINPEVIDLTVDSIDVNIVVYNLGRSVTDSFAVELIRTFPNGGGDSLYRQIVGGIDYLDTIVFRIPFYNNLGVGLNTFSALIDIPSAIDEQFDEIGNNMYSRQVLFDVDGIYPVWPSDYAVIPDDTITLKASTVNPFADLATYRFEIDTTDLFNSPRHYINTQTSLGGVIDVDYDQWINATSGVSEELILEDSTVYFWRVAVDDDEEYYWVENSFQYINGKHGWGQDHFFQFKNNEFLFLNYERSTRQRFFGPATRFLECQVYGNAGSAYEENFTFYQIDGAIFETGFGDYSYCGPVPQLLVSIINPFTLKALGTRWDEYGTIPMLNPDNNFGNLNDNEDGCRARVEDYFQFYQSNPTQMDAFANMMRNEIEDSSYFLIYTSLYGDYSEWDADMFDVFAELGSDSIYPGRPEVPFIVFGKIGNPSYTREVYASDINDFIRLTDTLYGFDYAGEETSTLIGPAMEWDAVYWKQDPMESPVTDSSLFVISGITNEGTKTTLIETVLTPNDSIINLSTLIDANEYPYLQLNAQYWDSLGSTPAQLDRWHVLYAPVPEAALDGSAGVHWIPGDTIAEGQQIEVAFDISNISDVSMDSLLVNYWIEDVDHSIIPIDYPRRDSLRVGETITDTLTIPTVGRAGLNSLWVEVNPYNAAGVKDQIEQHHFNNIGQIPFLTLKDEENPILDVTFNGLHILNGDLIDPKSEILITLKDENPYLLMNEEEDTANFGIYLTDPKGIQRRLSFRNSLGEPLMEWIPADVSNKKFKIIYDSYFEENGVYRLLVQGIDRSGNISGDFEYDIEFEVDHNSSITHLMNYPNPFSTQTQFVFTLTGATVPDEFTIQIMTISGKVVREITRDELGPIHIGRNITDFTWNGTDEYGDLLANGVYLYRVIAKIDNEKVEHRESGADQYFTKEFGKMYIIR